MRKGERRRSPVDLLNDVFGDTVSLGVPPTRYLTSNHPIKLDCLGYKYSSTLFELYKPLARLLRPNVTFGALLSFEAGSVFGGDLEGFQVVIEQDFLVEDLLDGVVSLENLGF